MENQQTYFDPIFQQYQKRRAFAVHSALFGGVALLSIIFFLDQTFWRQYMTLPNVGDLLLILAVWSVCFLAHLAAFLTDEAYQRALSQVAYEKLKRLELNDDGEVMERIIDEETPESRRQGRLTGTYH